MSVCEFVDLWVDGGCESLNVGWVEMGLGWARSMGLGWLVGGRVALARRSSGHLRSELLAVELIEEDVGGLSCDVGFGRQSGR